MFDDLDDPSPAGVPAGAREAVAARAGRIRRNRQAGLAAGLASFLLVLGGTTAAVVSRDGGTNAVDPAAGASRSPSPSPAATPSSVRPPSRTPHPGPSTTPHSRPSGVPVHDTVGQWLGLGLVDGCRSATALPDAGGAPAPYLTIELVAPAEVSASDPGTATLVVTNTSATETAHLVLGGAGGGPVHTVASDGAAVFSGETYAATRAEGTDLTADLGPGESWAREVPLLTDVCAPERTREARGVPHLLPAGTYQVVASVAVAEAGPSVTASPAPESGDATGTASAAASPTASPAPSATPGPPQSRQVWTTAAVTVVLR